MGQPMTKLLSRHKLSFGLLLLAIGIITPLLPTPLSGSAAAWAGTGSVNSPYKITNCQDLYDLGQQIIDSPDLYRSKHYRQTANIDCASWDNDTQPFMPIGYDDARFIGTYNGQGYEISNLVINHANETTWRNVGLFGNVESATLKNIRLVNVQTSGVAPADGGATVGLLAGYIIHSDIENVSVQGSVNITSDNTSTSVYTIGGGIAGSLTYGDLNNAYADVDIQVVSSSTSTSYGNSLFAGGIAGELYAIDVTNTYSRGNITATGGKQQFVGGFTGRLVYENGLGGSVTNSFSSIDSITASTAISSPMSKVASFIGDRDNNADINGSYTLSIDELPLTASGANTGITEIQSDEPGVDYFSDITNAPMDSWCFELDDDCDTVIWYEEDNDMPTLVDPQLELDTAYIEGRVEDQITEEGLDNATFEISCETDMWFTVTTATNGEFELSVTDLADAMDTMDCSNGDQLTFRASASGYYSATDVVDPSIVIGEGGIEGYVNTFVAENPELVFGLLNDQGIEMLGPNNGDANNDEIPDSEQSNVRSFINPVTGEYAVLAVGDNCGIDSVNIEPEEINSELDDNYEYPAGLMDFELDCDEEGITTTVDQYYYGTTGNFKLRKYNPDTETYSTITSASITDQTIGGDQAKVASYEITDGGELDADGEANSYIYDPAGLGNQLNPDPVDEEGGNSSNGSGNGSSQGGGLADTGQSATIFALVSAVTLVGSGLIIRRKLKN